MQIYKCIVSDVLIDHKNIYLNRKKIIFILSKKTIFVEQKNMTSNTDSSKLPRITVSLDLFDETIISMMSGKRGKSKSEAIRFIVSQWILSNSKTLKEQYSIDTEQVSKELEIKDMEKYIEEKVNELISFSSTFNNIDIDLLAETLDMSKKRLMEIIRLHREKLEEKGIKIRIDGNKLIKE